MNMFSLLLASALVSAPAQAVDIKAIQRIITNPKAGPVPGCAAGAFREGKTLFVAGAGYADLEARQLINADTLFYAASISKQFTALAAAKLIEQDKIGLDDDIRKYFPELPVYAPSVTVRMLMHHTAGIRDSLELASFAGVEDLTRIKKDAVLQLVLRQTATNYPPGSAYAYSNGGYLLLAEIVARVSGMPFADYAKKAILTPLGMKRSFFMNDQIPSGTNIAHGYVPVDQKYEIRDTYPKFSGSGGLMTSLNDFAKYDREINTGGKVWTPRVREIMLMPGTLTDGRPAWFSYFGMAYGGGLMIGRRKGQFFVEHGGAADAFRTMFARLPERKLGVVIFCNSSEANAGEKADAIIEAVEGDILVEDEATALPPAFPGIYVSDALQSTYDLKLSGNDLIAMISSPWAEPGSKRIFKRVGAQWLDENQTELEFDADGSGFTLNGGRVRALRFRRAD